MKSFLPLLAILALGAAACSGAAKQSVNTAPADDPGATTPAPDSGAAGNGQPASGDDGSGGAPGDDASAAAGGDAGGNGNGGGHGSPSHCPPTATSESESNDTAATANSFTDVACGAIDPVGDVDYWTFTLSAQAKGVSVDYHGAVHLVVTSNGDSVDIPGNAPVPFHPGADYVVKVFSTSASAAPYTLTVR